MSNSQMAVSNLVTYANNCRLFFQPADALPHTRLKPFTQAREWGDLGWESGEMAWNGGWQGGVLLRVAK